MNLSELDQLKMLMEAVDHSYHNYEHEETSDPLDPYIQAHNLTGDDILDAYRDGKISYEQAESALTRVHTNPDDLDVSFAILNTIFGDTEVEWDEESGGGILPEDAIEGELITQDRTTAAGIARDIIKGAGESLYNDGMKPTAGSILQRSEKMAGAFYNQLLMAIDNELGKSNE